MTLCQLCLADRPVRPFVAPPWRVGPGTNPIGPLVYLCENGRAIVETNIAAGRHALSVPRYLRYYPVPDGCPPIGQSAP